MNSDIDLHTPSSLNHFPLHPPRELRQTTVHNIPALVGYITLRDVVLHAKGCTHARTHARMHARTRMHAHTNTHTRMPPRMHTHTNTHAHTRMHARTHTHTHTHY